MGSVSEENPQRPPRRPRGAAQTAPPRPERRLIGIPVSAGVAIGQVFGAAEQRTELVRQKIHADDIAAQTARLEAAVLQSRKQLLKLRARLGVLPEDSQAEIAPLIDAYLQMIGPSRLLRGARKRIADMLVSAETAVADTAEDIAAAILAMVAEDDAGARQRHAEEVREIARRLLRNLTNTPFRNFADIPEGAVLICENLRPSDAALLDPTRLAGVATDEGGADGHTAIMLRALGIPAVLGVTGLSQNARPGDTVVVDGAAGAVTVSPGAPALAAARRAVAGFARERQKLTRLRRLPAVTLDGETIELQANLEIPGELSLITQAGASGIGLLRSEFLFMNRETLPDEAAQYRDLPLGHRCHGRRSGDDPRAGLGRRERNRGAAKRRRGARSDRPEPGARVAWHPAAAAPAGVVRGAAGGDPARFGRRPDAGAAADGDQYRRGAGRAGNL